MLFWKDSNSDSVVKDTSTAGDPNTASRGVEATQPTLRSSGTRPRTSRPYWVIAPASPARSRISVSRMFRGSGRGTSTYSPSGSSPTPATIGSRSSTRRRPRTGTWISAV
ncbi:uncharacterized protein LOC119596157 [Penaeus monodon]|uniref:uncharacterized protein LOC119596157 n=1 Tax=Penaeus monodon TaxID=6687 RepID=UPI0018A7993C|nr:uncharacterized protein LOC119596157 [Penaeus monodon]